MALGNQRTIRRWWVRIIGPCLVVILLTRLEPREIVAALGDVDAVPLMVSLALLFPYFLVKAWRWRRLLEAQGGRISLARAWELYTISAGAGAITPGAIGDFWKGLSPDVGTRSVGVWTSGVDRVFDVAFLVVLGSLIASFRVEATPVRLLIWPLIAAVCVCAWKLQGVSLALLRRRLPRLPAVIPMNSADALLAAATTILAGMIAWLRFALLVRSLRIPIGWEAELTAYALTSGVVALPLSVAGVGTRDLTLIGFLGAYGVAPAKAVALSSLCLALYLWNAVVAAALWTIRPGHRAPRVP